MPEPIVAVENLAKRYGKIDVLKNITFRIFAGEFFGLIGPNGAGKTTFIGILTGVLQADGGSILIGGRDFREDPMQTKSRLGFVPQSIAVYPSLSARDNLAFFARLHGLQSGKLRERIDASLDAVGLRNHARQKVGSFSHGMQKRLNIAAGLVHEPELLMLDEPTAGLDTQSRKSVLDVLGNINKSGVTILYTTHYIEEAECLCSRVGIMDAGRLISIDTPEGMIRKFGTGVVRIELKEAADDMLLQRIGQLGSVTVTDDQNRKIRLETDHPEDAVKNFFGLGDDKGSMFKRIDIVQASLETVVTRLTEKRAAP